MQIIYNITLTLWVAVAAMLFADLIIFKSKPPEWFGIIGGATLLAGYFTLIVSMMLWIWSR